MHLTSSPFALVNLLSLTTLPSRYCFSHCESNATQFTRHITSLGSSLSRILGIILSVFSFTQPLTLSMVVLSNGDLNISALYICLQLCTNCSFKVRPCLSFTHSEFAILSLDPSVLLLCAFDISRFIFLLNVSVSTLPHITSCICLRVLPSAPFIVIPSANATDSGEISVFFPSARSFLTEFLKSCTEKPFTPFRNCSSLSWFVSALLKV